MWGLAHNKLPFLTLDYAAILNLRIRASVWRLFALQILPNHRRMLSRWPILCPYRKPVQQQSNQYGRDCALTGALQSLVTGCCLAHSGLLIPLRFFANVHIRHLATVRLSELIGSWV